MSKIKQIQERFSKKHKLLKDVQLHKDGIHPDVLDHLVETLENLEQRYEVDIDNAFDRYPTLYLCNVDKEILDDLEIDEDEMMVYLNMETGMVNDCIPFQKLDYMPENIKDYPAELLAAANFHKARKLNDKEYERFIKATKRLTKRLEDKEKRLKYPKKITMSFERNKQHSLERERTLDYND